MGKEKRKRDIGDAGRCTKARSKNKYAKKGKKRGRKPWKTVTDPDEQQQSFDKLITDGSSVCVGESSSNVNATPIDNENIDLSVDRTMSDLKIVDIDIAVGDQNDENTTSGVDADNECNVINNGNNYGSSGYRLIDLVVLSNLFNSLACPECFSINTISICDVVEKKKGLARYIELSCSACPFVKGCYTSNEIKTSTDVKKRGRNSMEVNIRAVYACRSIGVGHTGLIKLCGYMNMPPPMTSDNYACLSNSIKTSSKLVAEKTMIEAGKQLLNGKETADTSVSVDGTWQRKGFSSKLGVVAAISVEHGKVLDISILSKSCKACVRLKGKEKTQPEVFKQKMQEHSCNLNYKGSSPNMEKSGTIEIFSRSIEKHGLYYTSFYGDGDSKSFAAVQNIYGPDKPVNKFECIGHYQKRVGSRLRKLKKTKKGLGGKGRLTDAKIDTLQNYFGIALRKNVGNLDEMVAGCMSSMMHVAGYHDNCPKTMDTWCSYQKDKLEGKPEIKSKSTLPCDVRKEILPVYQDLCKPTMLAKCLHGKTQNPNESFNGMIWNRVPKANHVGLDILSLGVYDAIAHFNIGAKAAIDTMVDLNIAPGFYTRLYCMQLNNNRKRHSAYRMSESQKKRRKILRHIGKKANDANVQSEGLTYEAGGF